MKTYNNNLMQNLYEAPSISVAAMATCDSILTISATGEDGMKFTEDTEDMQLN